MVLTEVLYDRIGSRSKLEPHRFSGWDEVGAAFRFNAGVFPGTY